MRKRNKLMISNVIAKDKLFTIRKDKNDLYYVHNPTIDIYRLLNKWQEATRDYTNKHPKEDMAHILRFMKLYGIEYGLEVELWLAKETK